MRKPELYIDNGSAQKEDFGMRVLVVGEVASLAEQVHVASRLRWPDAQFVVVRDRQTATRRLEAEGFDLVVVIAQALQGEAPALCHAIRDISDIPILVIGNSDRDTTFEDIRALEAGADDFVHNTVGLAELVARLVALMRRTRAANVTTDAVDRCGSLALKPASYEAYLGPKKIDLTATEFQLLHLLTRSKGAVVRHQVIERALWGNEVDASTLVKKYVHRVRRKLEEASDGRHEFIRSIYGIGYLLVSDQAAPSSDAKIPA